MKRVLVTTYNSWGRGRNHVVLDFQFEVVILEIKLIGLEVVLYHSPFDFDLGFGILGLSISFSSCE